MIQRRREDRYWPVCSKDRRDGKSCGQGPAQGGVGKPAATMRALAITLWDVNQMDSAGAPV